VPDRGELWPLLVHLSVSNPLSSELPKVGPGNS
jgi:hypothetical protein